MKFPGGLARLTKDGSEILDPTPVEMPIGFERPPSIQELIRQLVRDPALRDDLRGHDIESFDEADDFDVADDEPISPHEDNFDPLHLLAREQEIMSGAVKERSPEEKKAAIDLYHRAKAIALKMLRGSAAPQVPPEEPPPAAGGDVKS